MHSQPAEALNQGYCHLSGFSRIQTNAKNPMALFKRNTVKARFWSTPLTTTVIDLADINASQHTWIYKLTAPFLPHLEHAMNYFTINIRFHMSR